VLGTLAGLLGRAADAVAARLWRAGHSITANHTADPIHPGTRHRGRVIRSRPEELSQSRSTEFPGGELVSFVLARLTEDREVATAALDATDQPYPPAAPALAAHHDRHSPNRVLRDVDATTAVAHLWLAAMMRHPDGLPPDSLRDLAEAVLAEFAAVHPDHPDFQRAWLNVSPSPPNDLRQDPNNRPISNVIPFPRNCPT
jgi:hypothetical protein